MEITFLGAAREVTGSMHRVSYGNEHLLLDCGLFQGRRKEAAEKNKTILFPLNSIRNIILSHAHLDHSGRIPLLVKNGFQGNVYTTIITRETAKYLLLDSANIQEADANYLNYKALRATLMKEKNSRKKEYNRQEAAEFLKEGQRIKKELVLEMMARRSMEIVEPLYSIADTEIANEAFFGVPYKTTIEVGTGTTCTFYDAGHILGSAIVILRIQENGKTYRICFTGDLGRFHKAILEDPTVSFDPADTDIDLLITESTYGDRIHEETFGQREKLKQVIIETFERGGTIMIPAFAYGRTQEMLYHLHEFMMNDEIPKMPIYVDSPLASKITTVFGEHPEAYDHETHETFLSKGENPFYFDRVTFVDSVEASMAVNRDETPHIVIAGSGMCEGGRILHHLRHKIHNPKHTVLLVGFMAEHTLGRRIQELGMKYAMDGRTGEPPVVKILGKEYPLAAHVEKIEGMSAHGDKNEMLKILVESNLKIKKAAVVHGEEAQSLAFAELLRENGIDAFVPSFGESVRL